MTKPLLISVLREVKDMFLLNVSVASYFLYVFPLLHLRPVANILTDSKHCLFSAIMNLITAFLLMILIGHSTSDYRQTLLCPYENRNISQNRRVWCKRDVQDESCCTGFSFQPGASVLENGNIQVQDDGKSFTISVQTLAQGDGVYWCGFMTADRIIVKLAEDYFSIAPINFVWSILRWILFLLLPLMTISFHIYSKRKHGDAKAT